MNDLAGFLHASSPQLIASYVSGIVSMLCVLLTGAFSCRIHRQKLAHDLDIEKIREVKRHVERTQELLHRVDVSFGRLATMASLLDEDGMLVETTNTLDVYAEYTRHLASPNIESYPEGMRSALAVVRKEISRLFLDLRRGQEARAVHEFAALMSDDALRLHRATSRVSDQISALVRVRL